MCRNMPVSRLVFTQSWQIPKMLVLRPFLMTFMSNGVDREPHPDFVLSSLSRMRARERGNAVSGLGLSLFTRAIQFFGPVRLLNSIFSPSIISTDTFRSFCLLSSVSDGGPRGWGRGRWWWVSPLQITKFEIGDGDGDGGRSSFK